MKRSRIFFAGMLAASLGFLHVGTAWSEPSAKTPAVKAVAKKAKQVAPKATVATTLAMPAAMVVVVPTLLLSDTLAAVPTPQTPAPQAAAPVAVAAAVKVNPYLVNQVQMQPEVYSPQQTAPAEAAKPNSARQLFASLKEFLPMPSLPMEGQAILPVIKKVYPTGEKPLVVLTFKCPTELVGITPLPTKALHGLVNMGFDAVNKTDLLSFNMQQVCQ